MMTYAVYIEDNHKLYNASMPTVALFDLLRKLKIKSIPTQKIWTFTLPAAGNYIVSCEVKINGNITTVSNRLVLPQPKPLQQLQVKAKISTKDKIKKKMISREVQRQWRNGSFQHQRNTARRN